MVAVVLRVVDGDTVVLRILGRRVRVRIIGMDAPETWLRHDCFGAEATRALRRLAPPGSAVYAAGDAEPYDRYGRRLLYLWTARGVFVEAAIIRAGYARALPVPPDTARAALLREAEDAARRTRTGRWGACP
jgi:micrococcal nuclease